jgi:F5/8 type C domain/Secretion system C-terminal sorting domain/Fibronectin type III domain
MSKFYPCYALLLMIVFGVSEAFSQTDVLTQHNDLGRTGWNSQETILNTSNVNTNTFGFLYSRTVDDQIYAQPLIVSGVSIPSAGSKNILFVCTVNNTIYAFDADNGSVGAYWQKNFTPSGYRPPNKSDMHPGLCGGSYNDFSSNIGIVGTPVIDKSSNTLYFVTKLVSTTPGVEDNHTWNNSVSNEEYTYTTNGFHQYLHAIDLSTGAEKTNSPVEIIDTLPGSGDGNVSGRIGFDPRRQFNRGGLVLSRGIVYLTFSAHCDWNPAHGWVIGYDASSLQLKMGYISTPNDGRGGIWMSGAAPAVDASGSLYFTTGNAYDDEDGFTDLPSNSVNRGESVVKLTPNAPDNTATALNISSYFTPHNYLALDDADLDFPIQALLVPNTSMLVTGVKGQFIYVLDTAALGGYNSTTDNVLQSFAVSSNAQMHSSFAYFGGSPNQYVYQFSENSLLESFKVNNNTLGSPVSGTVSGPTGISGAYMSVSSNGTDPSSAILWITHAVNGCNANQQTCPGILRAVKADDVTTELWNSTINPADNLGNFSKMNCPSIANGKIYVNSFSNQLMVYGLASNATCTAYPNVASSLNNPAATYSASSTASGTPASAFDGNQSTSWTAASTGAGSGDTARITVDLGAKYDICKVVVYWGSNYGKAFNIQGSNDGISFTTLYTVTGNVSVENVITLSSPSYQYIRMQGVTRSSTSNGYVIDEMEVYGQLTNLCSSPANLLANSITQNSATLNWQSVPGATSYNIQYKTSLVSSWVTRATSSTSLNIAALTCNTGYTYEVQAVCPVDSSAEAISTLTTNACTATCGSLPTRYFSADIGDIGVAGSSCLNNGIYTIQGSGTDIGSNNDEFQYAFTNLAGDEHVFAEVLTQDATSAGNKAGLMFRDSVSNTSRFIFIGTTSANGIVMEYRTIAGGPATVITVPGINAPYWLELNKNGTQYTAYISPTGLAGSWVQVGTVVDLGFGSSSVNVGMAVTSNNNTVLSTATIGSFTIVDGALPVKLLSFTASIFNNLYVVTKWSTSTELDSKYFNVQKSADAQHFATFAQVNAAGNSYTIQNYSASDYHPVNGYNFYRLQIVDNDGTITYSPIAEVNFGNQAAPQVFPNPASSYFIVAAGQEAIKEVRVMDVSGKVIRHFLNPNNAMTITINAEKLAGGVYIIQISTASAMYQQKLFKQ